MLSQLKRVIRPLYSSPPMQYVHFRSYSIPGREYRVAGHAVPQCGDILICYPAQLLPFCPPPNAHQTTCYNAPLLHETDNTAAPS